MSEAMAQFCQITGASTKDAKRYLEKYKRIDIAVDAYYNDPHPAAPAASARVAGPSTSKLNTLFDGYKDADADTDAIGLGGTIRMCADLSVDPEDVVLLAVAYELKSPQMGQWPRKGWVDGWKALGCDTLPAMQSTLAQLRDKLAADSGYFTKVYAHTFDFARAEGQRSLALESAIAFWNLLLPYGLRGGALSHIASPTGDGDEDMDGDADGGWTADHTQWWFEFLTDQNLKGVSKDTWKLFEDFVRVTDARFEKHDWEGSWPSTIDDFVVWAKQEGKV